MRILSVIPVLATVLALVVPIRADAQGFVLDHLKCFKVKDSAKFTADATLSSLQAIFGAEECVLRGKGKLFCARVDKKVSNLVDKSKPPLEPASFAGTVLEEGRLCYKIKCPKRTIATPLVVTDQFGSRDLGKFKPRLLCTPASIPGTEQEFDVLFQLDDAVSLGALQFNVNYSAAPGVFDGSGLSVECTDETGIGPGGVIVLNDDDAAATMFVSLASLVPVVGPTPIISCRFTSSGTTPFAPDFVVNVTDASEVDLTPVVPFPTVSVVSITAAP